MVKKKYKIIDLFSGCGGFSQGFLDCGFEVVLAIDNWKDALNTFKYNHQKTETCCEDLSFVSPGDFAKKYAIHHSEIDVIIGGPPCQGFSIAGKRDLNDSRNTLYRSFHNFVEFFRPKIFLMENVPAIASMDKGSVKNAILQGFSSLGYELNYKVLNSADYGVPQLRKRFFLVGIQGATFPFPEATHGSELNPYITAEEAINDLPEKSLDDGSSYLSPTKSQYQELMRKDSSVLFNHQISSHSEKTKFIIDHVPDGGNYKNLPLELQKSRNVNIAWTRLNSKRPSFTIDTGHRHHFHYIFNRIPTVRESARMQSFPDDFIFIGSKTSQYKQVGNAVPPLLSRALARNVLRCL